MKKYIGFILSGVMVLSLVGSNFAQASTLNSSQINAIIALLQAFGVSQTTISTVQNDLSPQVSTTTSLVYQTWTPANLRIPISQPAPVINPYVAPTPILTPSSTPILAPTTTPMTMPVLTPAPTAPAPTPAPISASVGTSSLVATVGDLNWPIDISGNVWEVAQIFLSAKGVDGVNLNSLTITDTSDAECTPIIYEGGVIYENRQIVYSSGGTSSTFPNPGSSIFISSTTPTVLNVALNNCMPSWSATTGTPALFELTNINATDAVTGAQDVVTGESVTQ